MSAHSAGKIPVPDTKPGKKLKSNKPMEEKMFGLGLMEMDSSELLIRGGASPSTFENIVTKVRYVINFIADYVPKLVKGFIDGYSVTIFNR